MASNTIFTKFGVLHSDNNLHTQQLPMKRLFAISALAGLIFTLGTTMARAQGGGGGQNASGQRTDAITTAAGEGAAALDNPAISSAVTAVDGFIDCYTEVGAVSANIYTQVDLGDILSSGDLVPSVGTVAVVNQDLVQENFVACATGGNTFSAQSATEVCRGSGQFTANDDTFRYIFIGTNQAFCSQVETHFAGLTS